MNPLLAWLSAPQNSVSTTRVGEGLSDNQADFSKPLERKLTLYIERFHASSKSRSSYGIGLLEVFYRNCLSGCHLPERFSRIFLLRIPKFKVQCALPAKTIVVLRMQLLGCWPTTTMLQPAHSLQRLWPMRDSRSLALKIRSSGLKTFYAFAPKMVFINLVLPRLRDE